MRCAFMLSPVALAALVNSHSWVERVSRVSPEGWPSGVPGYIRGYVQRTSVEPPFNDEDDTYLLPPNDGSPPEILTTDMMCSQSQLNLNYSSTSPLLKAKPGDIIVLQYNENGHITLPENNAPGKLSIGTVSVYGVEWSAFLDSFLGVHGVWNHEGTGNSRGGRLLQQSSFDDGKCYQFSTDSPIALERESMYTHPYDPAQSVNLWCDIYVQLPEDLQEDSYYTLYWVWDWPTSVVPPDITAKPEVYTSCLDVLIKSDI